jgi:ribosomal protein L11 methyltransferase
LRNETYTCLHIKELEDEDEVAGWARKGIEAGASGAEELERSVKLYFPEEEAASMERFQETLEENGLSVERELLPDQDWNRRWEESFRPVHIGKDLVIRAPFHPPFSDRSYRIEVLPERAFGTGHHPTTQLILQELLRTPLEGRRVLDMGCGTGILAILCEMRGARTVHAFDNDPWAVRNCRETIERNGCERIFIEEAEAPSWKGTGFDVILGNIQRDPLLRMIPDAVKALTEGGRILLSGLRRDDLSAIDAECRNAELVPYEQKEEDEWFMLAYRKDVGERSS